MHPSFTVNTPQTEAHFDTRSLLEIGIVTVFFALIYGRTMVDLFNDWWTQPSLSQGMLIPPLAIYFAYLNRKRLIAAPAEPDARGVWIVASGCLLFLIGRLAAEFFVQRVSMIVMLAGLIWFWWGKGWLAQLAFPIILLTTMIPLPAIVYNTATAPLQLFASDIAARVAQVFHVSVYRDGNIIQLAHTALGVEEACSGLNSFSALMVAAVLLGRLLCDRLPARALLFFLSAPLSIAVNVLRIAGTAILADYDEKFAIGFYHSFGGWLVFLLGFLAFIGIAKAAHAVLES
jgi:exosortase